jgi:hypothetical protein
MKLPKNSIEPKLTEQELIEIIEKIEAMKAKAIKNQQYEHAAKLRDDQRKYYAYFEDIINLKEITNTEDSITEEV